MLALMNGFGYTSIMKRVPLLLLLCCPLIRLTAATVTDLRCEYLRNPLGIDSTRPRLSWAIQSDVRGEQQTAYQVLVASSEQVLKADRWDLWDSGKVLSDRSIQLDYAGRELTSHQQCFWKVRIWDKDQKPSSWSDPVFWSMGLLQVDDWKAKWIGLSVEEKTNYLTGTDWIWFPEGDPTKSAPLGNRYFRRQFVIPPEREIKRARFLITGDSECKAFFNGRDIGGRNNYRYVKDNDVTFRLEPGTNFIAVLGKNYGTEPKPAGLIALLEIQFTSGDPIVIKTDGSWKASDQEIKGWNEAGFNDSNWVAAKDLGPAGMEPWNNVRAPEDRRLAARWLRKEFEIKKPVKRAIAYYSGLGLSELYVNGEKAGDHVLSPGLTEYPKRVYYVTFDVTKQVRPGVNALGVVLGNGRFYSPRSRIYAGMPSCGFPKLLLHLRIEHTDGSISEVVSDETWKITADGPITANNE